MWNSIGTNKIHATAIIGENVELGENNIIYPYSVIGELGFIRDYESQNGKIIIGDNNWIGCHTAIMAGEKGETIIGNKNLIMNYVNVGHNVEIGSYNEIGAKSLLAGWSVVGDQNKIKLNCTLRNRKIIGSYNIIGMGSNIVKDLGSHGLYHGNPCTKIKDLLKYDNF